MSNGEKEVSLCGSESGPFRFPHGVSLLIFGWTSQTRFTPLQGGVTFVQGFLRRSGVPARIGVLQLWISTLGTSSTLARSVLVPILHSIFFSECIFYVLAALHRIWDHSPTTTIKVMPPALEGQVSTTGLPGKSPLILQSLFLVLQSLNPVCLQPHGLQHARPPCPSPTPRACSNSRPSSR